ncbi:MAG: BlaI/MecI/CopY family transcriptional regulator [bacterium]
MKEKLSKDLSQTELEIMEFLWECKEQGKVLSFGEILNHFNTQKNRNWKKQTLSTYLLKLSEREMVLGTKKGRNILYEAIVTPTGYDKSKAKGIINKMYSGSIGKFMSALYDGEKIPKEDAEELKKWLEDN